MIIGKDYKEVENSVITVITLINVTRINYKK